MTIAAESVMVDEEVLTEAFTRWFTDYDEHRPEHLTDEETDAMPVEEKSRTWARYMMKVLRGEPL